MPDHHRDRLGSVFFPPGPLSWCNSPAYWHNSSGVGGVLLGGKKSEPKGCRFAERDFQKTSCFGNTWNIIKLIFSVKSAKTAVSNCRFYAETLKEYPSVCVLCSFWSHPIGLNRCWINLSHFKMKLNMSYMVTFHGRSLQSWSSSDIWKNLH